MSDILMYTQMCVNLHRARENSDCPRIKTPNSIFIDLGRRLHLCAMLCQLMNQAHTKPDKLLSNLDEVCGPYPGAVGLVSMLDQRLYFTWA